MHVEPFYQDALRILEASGYPHLVGGAYALCHYTGIIRDTRDFDVFILPEHVEPVLERFRGEGYSCEVTFSHWLAKVHYGDRYVDVIFSSGNGVARVDSTWFDHAPSGRVLDRLVKIVPAEEMIWSKAYIMERERFDGADIAHLIHSKAEQLDWERLLQRFQPHPRVLLAHLILFGFVYPEDRARVPERVMRELLSRLDEPSADEDHVCRGTLLSRSQYLPDLAWGYRDSRIGPEGWMSGGEVDAWTEAAEREHPNESPVPVDPPDADPPTPPERA